MSPSLSSQVRRATAPAGWALRAYWGTAVLLAAAAGIGLVATLPVTALVGRLRAPLARVADLGLGRSSLATGPNELRAAATAELFHLLLLVAMGVLCVAALSLLAVAFARGGSRVTELAVRRAVGASRRLILVAALIEGGVIAVAALAWGGVGGAVGTHATLGAWPGTLRPGPVTPAVMVLAGVVSLVLLAVLVPLGSMRRRRPLATRSGRALELVVPALQLGLSLTVLAASALLADHAARLRGRDRVAAGDGQLFAISLATSDTAGAESRYADLLRRVSAQPGVTAASLTSPGTTIGLGQNDRATTDCGQCAWGNIYVPFRPVYATHYLVSADTFRTLGLRVLAGRTIANADDAKAPLVAVVSQSLAAANFQDRLGVGRRIQVGVAPTRWYTVVGVVADQLPAGFGAGFQPRAAVYLSVLQHPIPAVDLLVRARGDARVYGAVERELRASLGGSGAATTRVGESHVLAAEAAPIRWFGRLFGLEGWVMLVVATIGTFVVLRLWVRSLLHDLGIRRAVGARRRHLYGFVFARALGIAVGGVALGCWGGMMLWGTLSSVVAGLPGWDTGAAERFGALLALAALVGALLPAWEAAHAAPARLVGHEEA
ncbi:MAG TPA: FtsX-like permease family protein [Gemmatimonadales bacterium]|nr:FtsX-like permease family protein [Gemmatimonadales bacterium]